MRNAEFPDGRPVKADGKDGISPEENERVPRDNFIADVVFDLLEQGREENRTAGVAESPLRAWLWERSKPKAMLESGHWDIVKYWACS